MEKRRLKRTKIDHPGRLFIQGSDVYDCTVRNFTGLGVCVEFTFDPDRLPPMLDFSFDNFRTIHACRIVWREGNLAGLEFKEEPVPTAAHFSGKAKLRLVR